MYNYEYDGYGIVCAGVQGSDMLQRLLTETEP